MITTTLLVTSQGSLSQPVADAVSSINDCRLAVVDSFDKAKRFLKTEPPAVVLYHRTSDADDSNIESILQELSQLGQSAAVVALVDDMQPAKLLNLLKMGIAEYLMRPLDVTRLAYVIDMLTLQARHASPTPTPVAASALAESFFCCTPQMETLLKQVQAVAARDTTILLTGETGTGKTHLARLIHEWSPRSDQPFMVVDCGGLSETLIESELFGHVKGSFTGADHDRIGKFGAADQGTLMLDEIDSVPLATQSRLLRGVEEKCYEPVGCNQLKKLNARLIVATNRDLEEEMAAGRFRRDLYYRVNVVAFHLPPLRERRAMIAPFTDRCLTDLARRDRQAAKRLSYEARQAFLHYDWPGNLRELRNVIEREVAICPQDTIALSDLPEAIQDASAPTPGAGDASSPWLQTRIESELSTIKQALLNSNDNRSRAARELGISRVTLYKKMHKFGLI